MADQDLRIVGDSVSVDIAVQNTGGRPIRYDEATLPAGAPAAMMRSVPPTKSDREIEVGTTTNVLVVFIKQACRAPEDAAATVRLRFHTPATGESQQVEVVLADTWLNLLGACGTRDLG